MKLILERLFATKHETMGRLTDARGRHLAFTLELPWRGNVRNLSCIPEGTYDLVPDNTGRHRWWKIPNVADRDAIEVHAGNTVADTRGCPLLGTSALCTEDGYRVGGSRAALTALKAKLGERRHKLEVKRG